MEQLDQLQINANRLAFGTLLQPLFHFPNPQTILYADKPTRLGGQPAPKALSEFEKEQEIVWETSPVMGAVPRDNMFLASNRSASLVNKDPICQSVIRYGIEGFHDWAICDISPKVGKGVFATKFVKAGTILGGYPGALESNKLKQGFCDYGYSVTEEHMKENGSHFYTLFHGALFNAKKYRNHVAYFQHASDEATSPFAATANSGILVVNHLGFPFLLVVALRDIEEGEQYLLNYGPEYWERNGFPPELFDLRGGIMGPDFQTENAIPGIRCTSESTQKVSEQTQQNNLTLHAHTPEYLVTSLKFAIELYQKQGIPNTEALFAELLNCFTKKESGHILAKLYKHVMHERKLEPFKALAPLQKELEVYLWSYGRYLDRIVTPVVQEKLNQFCHIVPAKLKVKDEKCWSPFTHNDNAHLFFYDRKTNLRALEKTFNKWPQKPTLTQIKGKDLLMFKPKHLIALYREFPQQAASAPRKKK